MSKHANKVHMETCFSEPKMCSNCDLQYPGEFWIFECLCGCDSTARVCAQCVTDHAGVFSQYFSQYFHSDFLSVFDV